MRWFTLALLSFSLTDDSLKRILLRPFTNEGKQQVVDWINAQYEDHPEKWSHEKKICINKTQNSGSLSRSFHVSHRGCIRMILFVFCCIHKVLHTIDGRVNALDI